MYRKILHVDLDAFFASVEELDNPALKGKPVIVGGTSERGVVATANYEARKYGVHSAMPSYIAKQKCPNGIFIRGNHERYRQVSKDVFEILYSITNLVQPISIDEAYLDVTHLSMDAVSIGKLIKKRVRTEVGITISVGVSYNKFLAKLASDWKKPNGLFVIQPDQIPELLKPLSVKKVHGLGAKSVEKLNRIGIFTIGDLLKYSEAYLTEYMGSFGSEIYHLIRGEDQRPVKVTRKIKSIGRETTLSQNTTDVVFMKEIIEPFCHKIYKSLVKKGLHAKTVTVKYKTANFQNHTRSRTLLKSIYKAEDIFKIGCEIMDDIEFNEPIRLIGITVSNLHEADTEQLSLF